MICPECGGTLSLVTGTTLEEYAPPYHHRLLPVPTRVKPVVMLACSTCEYAVKVVQTRKK